MENKTILPAATVVTSTQNSSDFGFSNNSSRGALFFLNVSAVTGTTPTLTVQIQAKDSISGNYLNISGAVTASINSNGLVTMVVYPGIAATTNTSINAFIPGTMRAVLTTGGTSPNFTLSLGVQALA